MAPTSYSDLKLEPFAAYDGGLDVGDVSWGYDEQWFMSSGSSESEISNVGVQDRRVGRVVGKIGDGVDWIRRIRMKRETLQNGVSGGSDIRRKIERKDRIALALTDIFYCLYHKRTTREQFDHGASWGLTALDLLGKLDTVDVDEAISWLLSCQHESGGFGGNVGHDPHILYTLSVVQVLALFDKMDVIDVDKDYVALVGYHIVNLQNEDGSFSGDMWGEVDTRFSYIAICCLSILHRLDKINVEKAVKYIISCKNMDGGFGCTPGGESHASQNCVLYFFPTRKGMLHVGRP
ncbi:unnamed protein product [Sphenostylis stenocarpa]|uniref:Prenyltransferase alpha-alpha toroid domain-containing protein n=1 Tax=Sphenostylis stenocarpa TaxID=92480 RepID=A0AA86VC40_9FABA|nr:unnamed protein product [Sphenostylis stenocarpa]